MTTSVSAFLTFLLFISIIEKRQLHIATYADENGRVYQATFSTVVTVICNFSCITVNITRFVMTP